MFASRRILNKQLQHLTLIKYNINSLNECEKPGMKNNFNVYKKQLVNPLNESEKPGMKNNFNVYKKHLVNPLNECEK